MSIENSAQGILERATNFDNQHRYTESLICYQEGLQILVDMIKVTQDAQKKTYLRKKIEDYMERAEKIKNYIARQKEEGIYREQIKIDNDSIGHSYNTLFGRFLDTDVTGIRVEDPYIRSFHQCQNFLRVCELAVSLCNNLKAIYLVTGVENGESQQTNWFQMLKNDLKKRNIIFTYEFSTTLHDRQIILSSGWIVKIGRGLDIYKAPENKFTLGVYDLDLRHCHETAVDIFHSKDIKIIR